MGQTDLVGIKLQLDTGIFDSEHSVGQSAVFIRCVCDLILLNEMPRKSVTSQQVSTLPMGTYVSHSHDAGTVIAVYIMREKCG